MPSTPSLQNNSNNGKNAARLRNQANQKKYSNPLPILINSSNSSDKNSSTLKSSIINSYIPSFSNLNKKEIINLPNCIGTFDNITRSIWIEDEKSKLILFNRGFFGKGNLSRSEPSWKQRKLDLLKGGSTLAAEQMREARRQARKQFKIDRAAAMLNAAKQAEAILTSSTKASTSTDLNNFSSSPLSQDNLEEYIGEEGELEIDDQRRSNSPTPSTSTTITATTEDTIIDPMKLTAQTFLIRPTRPDSNRNRGKKAFRRRPPPSQVPLPTTTESTSLTSNSTAISQLPPIVPLTASKEEEEEEEEEEEDLFDESLVEDMEHLQLSLEEALFLSLGLGVLKVFDPISQTYIPNGPSLLSLLLTPSTSPFSNTLSTKTPMLPDDPLLVSYIAYHHFRSLGWVVKDGIKFCCDWLLYRKGPAFSHSAFACIVIPVYEDLEEKEISPYGNQDWYEEKLSWKWINTIMRVNALVQKTVIAVYVTIPSLKSFDSSLKFENGYLNPEKIDFKKLLQRYTVREVSLTRFGPSRRRD
ncbi:uncharacterized protein I206_102323 [Kwoniella pini CBS 10737]|uniref:tRNA-intron lyase n=1 Tax=Kwoniella pini CBS 10737 TaxID=1296096 RepID=A0A1B9HT67_9TREE|nr:uncharacterized protein I206_07693 [Kwoniella pini CBS 10737]OCF46458.1 hypothetical protein I206_07693 [Kwoniella pini CBS 10737]